MKGSTFKNIVTAVLSISGFVGLVHQATSRYTSSDVSQTTTISDELFFWSSIVLCVVVFLYGVLSFVRYITVSKEHPITLIQADTGLLDVDGTGKSVIHVNYDDFYPNRPGIRGVNRRLIAGGGGKITNASLSVEGITESDDDGTSTTEFDSGDKNQNVAKVLKFTSALRFNWVDELRWRIGRSKTYKTVLQCTFENCFTSSQEYFDCTFSSAHTKKAKVSIGFPANALPINCYAISFGSGVVTVKQRQPSQNAGLLSRFNNDVQPGTDYKFYCFEFGKDDINNKHVRICWTRDERVLLEQQEEAA